MNAALDGSKELLEAPPVVPRDPVQRWRLVLARDAVPPEAAGREQLAAWGAALADSGLPVAGLEAARPRPRFAWAAPLAAAIPGEGELLDIWLVERLPAWRVREAVVACLPGIWRLVELYDVWLGEPALPGRVAASVYRAEFAAGAVSAARLKAAARDLLAATTLSRERRKGEGTVAYDLRPFLDGLEVEEAGDGSVLVRMTLRHDPEKGVGRPEETLAALGERVGVVLAPASLARERLVLVDLAATPPSLPRRRPAPGPAERPAGAGGVPPRPGRRPGDR